jgi:DNA-binding LacI/PurR family transcriptional regulator
MARRNVYTELIAKLERKLCVLNEGAPLPSEQSLADEFGVSKPTLRRALDELLAKGQISKINGVGVFAAKCEKTIPRELIAVCHDIVFFANTLKRFGERAAKAGYFMSIVPLGGDAQEQDRILASALARRPAGLLIYGDPRHDRLPSYRQIALEGTPSVHLIRLPSGIDGNMAGFGNADGMIQLVETFYKEGCRKFALYSDAHVNPAAALEREEGFLAGMKKLRLRPNPALLCPHDATQPEREAFLRTLADPEKRPDAVCCLNDYCAGKLITKLTRLGVDTKSMRFSGFDHSPLSEFIPQGLLTVAPPMEALGDEAAELLIRQIENPSFAPQTRKLNSKIINTAKAL